MRHFYVPAMYLETIFKLMDDYERHKTNLTNYYLWNTLGNIFSDIRQPGTYWEISVLNTFTVLIKEKPPHGKVVLT